MDQILDTDKTSAIRQLLEQYSRNKNLGTHSLENAFRLACGRLPFVILLQEPCDAADVMPYEMMLTSGRSEDKRTRYKVGSPTLQEVEDAICAVSHGKIGLRDVSLIDINMHCSSTIQERNDFADNDLEEAQNLCLRIVKLIEPKVVLILTCVARQSVIQGIRLFSSTLAEAGTVKRKSVGTGDDCHPFSVIKGFHPSIFLRQDYVSRRQWGDEDVRCARRMFHMCCHKAILELWDEEYRGKYEKLQREWKRQCL